MLGHGAWRGLFGGLAATQTPAAGRLDLQQNLNNLNKMQVPIKETEISRNDIIGKMFTSLPIQILLQLTARK